MEAPVDLTNLQSITDGDKDLERELFQAFYQSFESCLQALSAGSAVEAEVWRRNMHSMKGAALNLGAEHLSHLCKQGQDEFEAPKEAKDALWSQVQAEYSRVKEFLQQVQ